MGFKLSFADSLLCKGLDKTMQKVGAAALMYCSTKAIELESMAKNKRPWTDRTGMAKATLRAKVTQPDESTIRIILAHGVDYGIWLELAHEKNYAIVGPLIQSEGPKIEQGLQGLFNNIKVF